MKIDYSQWASRALSIENLKLDIKNPRFSYQSTREMNQTEIIKYLIKNHDVYELAKSIAINGYLLNEEPIVCKEGGNYVVLEGNRRVAACKVILNPIKFLSPHRASELAKYGSIGSKIRCHIAPSRRDTDTLIYNKHTGIPLQKWDKISQDAFLISLIENETLSPEQVATKLSVPASDIRKAMRRHSIHQYSIKLFEKEPYELEQIKEQGFPITNFERFYDDERGLDFLGLSFGSRGEIQKRLPSEEFDRRFRFIVQQILSQALTSRTFNNEKDKKDYFTTIESYDKEKFDLEIKAASKPIADSENGTACDKQEDAPESEMANSKPPKRSRRKSGLFVNYEWGDTGLEKLDTLFLSIKNLNYKTHTNAAGILLRCYVDMLTYEFLLRKGVLKDLSSEKAIEDTKDNDRKYEELKKYLMSEFAISEEEINDDSLRSYTKFLRKTPSLANPSLGDMIAYIIKHTDLMDDNTRLVEVLKKFKKSNSDFIDLMALNMFVHNPYYIANSSRLEALEDEISPILDVMYLAIKNEN